MLKEGQQVSVYRVKEVISETVSHFCCLTEDPFFHSTVLLKVYPLEFLQEDLERDDLVRKLDELVAKLEHPSIAPVFDSGCEGKYFYYTTNYNYESPLGKYTAEGVPHEEILKIVYDLASALECAFKHGIGHGPLGIDEVFIADDGQAVIADFGFECGLRCFTEEKDSGWSEKQALKDLGRLLLQLLRPSSTDNSGREFELLPGIVDENIRSATEHFFVEEPDCYQSFSEVLGALGALIEKPPVESRPTVQHKSLTKSSESGITAEQRELVLPHVRQLISEKNNYKNLLDEALLKQNKTEDQLKQTLLDMEKFTQLQLMAPDKAVPFHRKKIVGWVLAGVVLGVALSGSYGSLLRQDPLVSKFQDVTVETQAIKIKSESETLQTEPTSSNITIASDLKIEILPDVTKTLEKKTPALEVQSQQWWPAGREFDVAVNKESITQREREDILLQLSNWINSWSQRDSTAYLSHYSGKYHPESVADRKRWIEIRRNRLLRPEWIKVEVQDIEMHKLTGNKVRVTFQQNYRSNLYQDQIRKSLNLVKVKGEWKINRERSLGKVSLVAGR